MNPSVPAPLETGESVPTPAALGAQLRLAIARLSRRIRRETAIAGDHLTASGMATLATIERLGPINLGDLAAVERVQPPSMTRIVARIEELGLGKRVTDAEDRRVARIEITEAGRTQLARSRTRKDAFLARRVARLTDAERAVLAAAVPILERLQDDQ
jgi:DNA-binding MarR family transcriptional regulator